MKWFQGIVFLLLASHANVLHGQIPQSVERGLDSVKETVEILYLNEKPNIDGIPDDWQVLQNSFRDEHSLYNSPFRNEVKYNFGWDEQNLYAIIQVHDTQVGTVLEIQDTVGIHLNDAIELWIDSRNDSKNIIDGNDYHFIIDVLNRAELFRGDKTLMELKPDSSEVPQSAGITPIVYQKAVQVNGRLNNATDTDSGYTVELAIPWSAIGIEPRQGLLLKMDLCNDDQDSVLISKEFEQTDTVRDKAFLSRYHYFNWSGLHDFGYPSQWRVAVLKGEPSLITSLSKEHPKLWLFAFILTTLGSFSIIGWMTYRLYKFKQIPARTEVIKHQSGKFVLSELNEQPSQSHQQKLISKARTYIESNIEESISSEVLAEHLAISVRQLQRIIKEELKSTPTNFIHIVRLEKAAAMLKNKEGNVTEIAFAVGFSDSSHFSRLFKRYYGVTPSQYGQHA